MEKRPEPRPSYGPHADRSPASPALDRPEGLAMAALPANSAPLEAATLTGLQQTIGNQATQRLLGARGAPAALQRFPVKHISPSAEPRITQVDSEDHVTTWIEQIRAGNFSDQEIGQTLTEALAHAKTHAKGQIKFINQAWKQVLEAFPARKLPQPYSAENKNKRPMKAHGDFVVPGDFEADALKLAGLMRTDDGAVTIIDERFSKNLYFMIANPLKFKSMQSPMFANFIPLCTKGIMQCMSERRPCTSVLSKVVKSLSANPDRYTEPVGGSLRGAMAEIMDFFLAVFERGPAITMMESGVDKEYHKQGQHPAIPGIEEEYVPAQHLEIRRKEIEELKKKHLNKRLERITLLLQQVNLRIEALAHHQTLEAAHQIIFEKKLAAIDEDMLEIKEELTLMEQKGFLQDVDRIETTADYELYVEVKADAHTATQKHADAAQIARMHGVIMQLNQLQPGVERFLAISIVSDENWMQEIFRKQAGENYVKYGVFLIISGKIIPPSDVRLLWDRFAPDRVAPTKL
jgi:hypothetical protein